MQRRIVLVQLCAHKRIEIVAVEIGFRAFGEILLVVGQATGVMLLGPLLFAVLGLVLVTLDILMMRWIITTFDRERVVASFL